MSTEVVEKSEMHFMETGMGQHLLFLQAGIREKIKEKLPKIKEISISTTKDIIDYQIVLLNEK